MRGLLSGAAPVAAPVDPRADVGPRLLSDEELLSWLDTNQFSGASAREAERRGLGRAVEGEGFLRSASAGPRFFLNRTDHY